MKFPCFFTRYQNVPGKTNTLGADVLPVAGGNPIPANASNDNCLFARFQNINAWPFHRVAVVYKPPSGTAALNSSLYFFEDNLDLWVKIGTVSLTPNTVVFYDAIVLLDTPNAGALSQGGAPTSGSAAYILIVDATGAPDGVHQFAMAPDVTPLAV